MLSVEKNCIIYKYIKYFLQRYKLCYTLNCRMCFSSKQCFRDTRLYYTQSIWRAYYDAYKTTCVFNWFPCSEHWQTLPQFPYTYVCKNSDKFGAPRKVFAFKMSPFLKKIVLAFAVSHKPFTDSSYE